MNPGYIYILQNPSLAESHLKIGRTERDPDERAAEISRATGVPTPFEVVWWSESVDCHLAESILHHDLAPYRTMTTREFFDIELDDAIRFARRAVHRSGGRSGGVTYMLRKALRWTFHAVVRPLLRFPVQLLLLVTLIVSWTSRSILFLAWKILCGAVFLLSALFAPRRRKIPARRKRAAGKPGRRSRNGIPAMQRNDYCLKEILGALLWISLLYFLPPGLIP